MAKPKSEMPLTKHTLNLYAGDYQKVRDLFPNGDAATIIRNVLHKFIEKVESAASALPEVDVDVR